VKYIISLFFLLSFLHSNSFEKYLNEENKEFKTFKNDIENEFEIYKEAYKSSLKEYRDSIGKKWPKKEISSKHKWVEYSKDYNQKKSINYEKNEIDIEVIAKNDEEAKNKIKKAFIDIYDKDLNKALKDDILEKKISKKLKKDIPVIKDNQSLVKNIISKKDKKTILNDIEKNKLKKSTYKGKIIYQTKIKLPSSSMINKAKNYSVKISEQSEKTKMSQELIYAIMHSESSFNPMARSHIPAFGLMQIVPRSAGVDTYRFLYGEKKLLSPSFLYNPNNNILIGSNYLHILYFRYLKNIKDPTSRLYCTIAAYNTGAGNVARTFIGSTNIKKASKLINNMSSDEVYKTLENKLPYVETKRYLKKVMKRMHIYKELIKNDTFL
jgi:membrane-bound lytic murein transglycosylase C